MRAHSPDVPTFSRQSGSRPSEASVGTQSFIIMAFVYILQSLRNSKYYIGSTTDLKRRLDQHNSGWEHTGKSLGPFELKFSQEFKNINLARTMEKKLKSLKRRDYIKKIIQDGVIKKVVAQEDLELGPIAQSVRAGDS